MDKSEYIKSSHRFTEIFGRYGDLLAQDSKEHVEQLLDNAELEMACESFILSIMDEELVLDSTARKDLLDLCSTLELDRESVFRADFWAVAHPFLAGKGGAAG
ncbi:MAG: hypothetical protein K0S28_1565 [Paucimonas sp.]|jgi:hypothetical protein|nr:hypothetical protein [Paucimonas sp.]